MKISLILDTKEDAQEVEMSDVQVNAFLQCNGFGYGGSYYRIDSRVFEFSSKGENTLSIIATEDVSVVAL